MGIMLMSIMACLLNTSSKRSPQMNTAVQAFPVGLPTLQPYSSKPIHQHYNPILFTRFTNIVIPFFPVDLPIL
jgi:hypothetical protein